MSMKWNLLSLDTLNLHIRRRNIAHVTVNFSRTFSAVYRKPNFCVESSLSYRHYRHWTNPKFQISHSSEALQQQRSSLIKTIKYSAASFNKWICISQSSKMSGDPKAGKDLDAWKSKWVEGQARWHKTVVHQLLVKHLDRLLAGKSNAKIFFPLCGKSLDMKWLADQGHTVVGVEASELAVQSFFTENDIQYTVTDVPAIDGKLYQDLDNKIRIYVGDFFKFSREMEGEFDSIWDRGSLVAIDIEDRERYVKLMVSLMSEDCQYLAEVYHYEGGDKEPPPHSVHPDTIHKLFENTCDVKMIEHIDLKQPDAICTSSFSSKVDVLFVYIYLFLKKK
ncbi:probable thiopurine S-methyltransferase [Lingula anatina]|uniref:thiopurine S-methyltransferase n=1 Tax=Lingula anatina TaxID=7574 RepID=A0A1S3HS60_LINAN|nr:probable thiopurine S-methyltransferase [Lingula anatina]|eukprot:XP_013388872.1 probable thiopurine S-methyltransferase [Lingula anatina]